MTPPAHVTSVKQQIVSGGIERTFRVYRPASIPAGKAVPLVVVLHGGFGSGLQAELKYNWDALANARGFAVAYPDGLRRAWNAGTCCGAPMRNGVNDVAFLDAMIRTIESQQRIDPRAIAVAGMSNGAMMAQRMACESSIPLRAVGSVSGTLAVPCAHPQQLRFMEIHGKADLNIPYGGGSGEGVAHVKTPPIPGVVAGWRARERCGAPQTTQNGIVQTVTADCANGTAVELIAIAGAGHQWPGSQPSSRIAHGFAGALGIHGPDPPSTALDATSTLYDFFFR